MSADTTEPTQEPTDAPVSAAETTEAPVQPEEPTEPENGAEEPEEKEPKGRNREAGYRVRAKEAEAERDALATQLAGLRDHLVAQALTGTIKVPASKNGRTWERTVELHDVEDALVLGGIDKASFFTADGFDEKGLKAAIGKLHDEKPQLFKQLNRPVPSAGKVPDSDGRSKGAFTAAFIPQDRR